MTVESPRLRVLAKKPVAAAKKTKMKTIEATQTVEQKTGKSIPDLLAGLIPFKIDRLVVNNGTLRFRQEGENINKEAEQDKQKPIGAGQDNEKEPGLDARVTDITIVVTNLTNTHKASDSYIATGSVSAKIMDKSPIQLGLRINPVAEEPKFNLSIKLEELPLAEINSVLDWQWGIRVDRGTFSLFSESAAADGAFKGNIKPLIQDLKIGKKEKRPPLQVIKEVVIKTVAHLLKNSETKTIGTEVPFEGAFENPKAGIWEAIAEVLWNAFVSSSARRF